MTRLELWNSALSQLRARPVESVEDTSAPAVTCRHQYPNAKQAVLEERPWGFSTAITRLHRLQEDTPGWASTNEVPAGAIRVWNVGREEEGPEEGGVLWRETYVPGADTQAIVADAEECLVASVTFDVSPAHFSPLAQSALVLLLASRMAVALQGERVGAKSRDRLYKEFQVELQKAAAADAPTVAAEYKTGKSKLVSARW